MARFRTGSTPPPVVLRAWVNDEFELLISEHILDEVTRTLAKPYFVERVDAQLQREMLRLFAESATIVPITLRVTGVATHPEDDWVLSAAVSASADSLVTGDKHFQRIGRHQRVEIVSPRAFQTILEGQSITP